MRYLLLTLTAGLAVSAGPGRAEDFTGFYAGVNAGYALDRGKHDRGGIPGPTRGAAEDDAEGLPPSALSAAQALRMNAGQSSRH